MATLPPLLTLHRFTVQEVIRSGSGKGEEIGGKPSYLFDSSYPKLVQFRVWSKLERICFFILFSALEGGRALQPNSHLPIRLPAQGEKICTWSVPSSGCLLGLPLEAWAGLPLRTEYDGYPVPGPPSPMGFSYSSLLPKAFPVEATPPQPLADPLFYVPLHCFLPSSPQCVLTALHPTK